MKNLRGIRYIFTGLFLLLAAFYFFGFAAFPGFGPITGLIALVAGILFIIQTFQK